MRARFSAPIRQYQEAQQKKEGKGIVFHEKREVRVYCFQTVMVMTGAGGVAGMRKIQRLPLGMRSPMSRISFGSLSQVMGVVLLLLTGASMVKVA